MAQKPLTGKYQFNTSSDLTVTTDFNNVGIPLKSILYNFKSGDVIDVQKMFFNDKNNSWEAQVSLITEANRTVPFSILNKVADNTPITTNGLRTEKKFGGGITDGQIFISEQSKNNSTTTKNETTKTNPTNTTTTNTQKKTFTTKNIIIGVIVVGAVFGFLKYKKII